MISLAKLFSVFNPKQCKHSNARLKITNGIIIRPVGIQRSHPGQAK